MYLRYKDYITCLVSILLSPILSGNIQNLPRLSARQRFASSDCILHTSYLDEEIMTISYFDPLERTISRNALPINAAISQAWTYYRSSVKAGESGHMIQSYLW
ncbi:hypothetical protein GGR54DRAFT_390600 [Hypoxylon sp. NC1633]|nr:hypothetical protein GGR54DRAFT_390600 [Hypoxylon sp. NC1633]